MAEWRHYLADTIVLFGLVAMTIAVIAMARIPDIYARLHIVTKGIVIGVTVVVLGTAVASEGWGITRAVLVGAFLVLTAPVSAHALARLEAERRSGSAGGEAPDDPD